MFTVLTFFQQYKVLSMTCTKTYLNWFMVGLSVMGYFLFCYLYGLISSIDDWYHTVNFTMGLGSFWLALLVLPLLILNCDVFVDEVLGRLLPTSQDSLMAQLQADAAAACDDCDSSHPEGSGSTQAEGCAAVLRRLSLSGSSQGPGMGLRSSVDDGLSLSSHPKA